MTWSGGMFRAIVRQPINEWAAGLSKHTTHYDKQASSRLPFKTRPIHWMCIRKSCESDGKTTTVDQLIYFTDLPGRNLDNKANTMRDRNKNKFIVRPIIDQILRQSLTIVQTCSQKTCISSGLTTLTSMTMNQVNTVSKLI